MCCRWGFVVGGGWYCNDETSGWPLLLLIALDDDCIVDGSAMGRQLGLNDATSFQINWRKVGRFNFCGPFSNEKSNVERETGSSWGLCNVTKNECSNADCTEMRRSGWICNILLKASKALLGVPGKVDEKLLGVLLGNFFINRFALSDVTKSKSSSGSFPNFSEMMES